MTQVTADWVVPIAGAPIRHGTVAVDGGHIVDVRHEVVPGSTDLGRVAMTLAPTPAHVEDFTITIRPVAGQPRGTFEFAWGDKVATAAFTVRP